MRYATYGDVYGPGRAFLRYLILTFGGSEVVKYYAQAPNTKNATEFGNNFAAFWGTDLDGVWAAVKGATPAWGADPICPCSLAPWTASGDPVSIVETSRNPYWTWPALGNDSAVWSGYLGSAVIADCRHEVIDWLVSNVMFARLDGPYYASVSRGSVARGPFVADSCETARPYALDPDLITSSDGLHITAAVRRPVDADTSVFLSLSAPSSGVIVPQSGSGTISICASCDFATPDCQPVSSSAAISVPQTFHVRWNVPTGAVVPQVVTRDLAWAPAASSDR